MKKHHHVEHVRFEGGMLVLVVDGKEIRRELKVISPRLAAASESERAAFEVTPSGYGIHWPLIDEDLSIDALLGVSHGRRRA